MKKATGPRCKVIMRHRATDVPCTRPAVPGDYRCKRHGGVTPYPDTTPAEREAKMLANLRGMRELGESYPARMTQELYDRIASEGLKPGCEDNP